MPVLAELRYRFRSEMGAPNEGREAFVGRVSAWLGERLDGRLWRAWVAVAEDGRVVGHAFAQLIEKIPNPVPEAEYILYITNVYVLPELRNQGIGGQLLEAALAAWPEKEKESAILWPSEESVSLYQRHGFARPRRLLERTED